MYMWKVSVKVNGVEKVFVSSRECVKEWLEWMLRKYYCECGMVWVKKVKSKDDLVFGFDDVNYVFYRKGFDDEIVWEKWDRRLF